MILIRSMKSTSCLYYLYTHECIRLALGGVLRG